MGMIFKQALSTHAARVIVHPVSETTQDRDNLVRRVYSNDTSADQNDPTSPVGTFLTFVDRASVFFRSAPHCGRPDTNTEQKSRNQFHLNGDYYPFMKRFRLSASKRLRLVGSIFPHFRDHPIH